MNATQNYHRFDAITVRAATRLLRRARSGQVAAWEIDPYLQHLADMDSSAGSAQYRALRKIARRRAACGSLETAAPTHLQRSPSKVRGTGALGNAAGQGPTPRPIERLWE